MILGEEVNVTTELMLTETGNVPMSMSCELSGVIGLSGAGGRLAMLT